VGAPAPPAAKFEGNRPHAGAVPRFEPTACDDCGGCVGVCPHDAIDLFRGRILFRSSCTECNLCVLVCPVDALAPLPGSPAVPAGKGAARPAGA